MDARDRRTAGTTLLPLVLLAAACTRPAAKGFTTVELVHRVTGRQERETVSFGRDAVRFTRPDGVFILRYADRTVFVLDDAEKTYAELSLEQFMKMQKERDHQPEVPDLVASVGGGAGIQMEATSQQTPIAGIAATLTRISADAFSVELWMSQEVVPPGPRRPTFEFLQALGGPLALPAVLFDHIGGFPVRSLVRVQGGVFGEIKVTRALLSLEREEPPAETFAVPDGYKKKG